MAPPAHSEGKGDRVSTDGPSTVWLAHVGDMPALEGPAGTAERLLLHLHYGIDWTGWLGGYRERYWDALLPDRVLVATWRAASLPRWWDDVAIELGSTPRTPAARREVEALLREPARPVLEMMREETTPLILRVRIVAEAVRQARGDRVPARPIEGRGDREAL